MSDRLEDHPDVAIHPPTVVFSALLLGYVLRIFLGPGLGFLPRVAAEGLGGIIVIIGIGIAISAISAFAEGGETLRPATSSDQLFTRGPFRRSRNPIYLAMILLGVGFGVATLNLWIIILSLGAGVVLNFFVIPQEEEYLARRFGDEYAAYKNTVRRWL